MEITREQLIDKLIQNDFETMMNDYTSYSDWSWFYEIILSGWKGYENYTNDELIAEHKEREGMGSFEEVNHIEIIN